MGSLASVVGAYGVRRELVSGTCVSIECGYDCTVMETIAVDSDGGSIHGACHILSQTDLIGGAVVGGDVNWIIWARGLITSPDS